MKLGLYGGGFKPFTTGHFSRLADAIRDNDKVMLFYGIQQAEEPAFYKRGNKNKGIKPGDQKPPRQQFRSIGDTGALYDENIGTQIFSVYEKAFERIPEIEVIPVYSQEIDEDFGKKKTPLNQIFKILDAFVKNPEMHEKVTVYGDGDSMSRFIDYPSIKRLRDQGKIQVGGVIPPNPDSYEGEAFKRLSIAGNKEAQEALRDYYTSIGSEDISDEDMSSRQAVRGTDVRRHASQPGDEEVAMRYLPPFLTRDEKMEIITIMQGDKNVPEQVGESFFMPIITDSTIFKAAARFVSSKKIVESTSKKKGEGHILGLAEDMALTFDNLKSLIDDVLSGRVEHIEEKMDGQNFTFTVLDSGEIRLFGKGVSETTLRNGGMGRDSIREHERWNENVKDTFGSGMDVVDEYLDGKDADLVRRLFQDGKVVVEGQVMTPVNPNTIPYTENHVRFVKPFTPYSIDVDEDAYRDLFDDADIEIQDSKGREWSLGPVPKLAQVQTDAAVISAKIHELQQDIDNLLQGMEPVPGTVGEYAARVLEEYIERVSPQLDLSGLSQDQKRRALQRLATGNKQIIGKPEMGSAWPEFQKFEKMRTAHVAAAIADLEKIIQKLGSYFFDTLEFALATNEGVVADLANEVKKIKDARDSDQIMVMNVDSGEISDMIDTNWATKLDTSLARVEQMDLFKKAVEGVVLRLPGAQGETIVRKLTGMFTPVHRLVGLFRYPDRSTRSLLSIQTPDIPESLEDTDLTDEEIEAINEALREFSYRLGWEGILFEGGNSFKNTEGEHLTTEIDRENIQSTLDHFFSNHLSQAGVSTYMPIGSTGKKSKSGDLDIVVGTPLDADIKVFKNRLLDDINISMTDGDAKLEGQNIAVMYPIQGSQLGEYVQIDIMLSQCPGDACWQMVGTGDGEIKGAYRNILMGHIAKRISQDPDNDMFPNKKIVIVSPGGLRYKRIKQGVTGHPHSKNNNRKWENEGPLVSAPEEILSILGINLSPEDALTFVDVANAINTDGTLRNYLSAGDPGEDFERLSFEEYMGRHLSNESTAAEARKAVDYINSMLENRLDEHRENILKTEHSKLHEAYNSFKNVISQIIKESSDSDSSPDESTIPFARVDWSESLKMFPGVWENRDSASATGGKDEEGAEKAVAISENLIQLGRAGYKLEDVGDGVLIQGRGVNLKLDKQEALNYMLGYEVSQSLPQVMIQHVPGLEKYDLRIINGQIPMEVKKMGGPTVLSKLGSATGRDFERNVPLIKPLRAAGQIAKEFIVEGTIVDENGVAAIRRFENPPDGFQVNEVAAAIEIINDLFFRIQYGNSSRELRGIMMKLDGGQLPVGMVNRIRTETLLDMDDRNALDLCTIALNSSLGEYSPAKSKDAGDNFDADSVDIEATAGSATYDGKVSLDYFYNDLIFRLFDSDFDSEKIDEDVLANYTQSVELLSRIYSSLVKVSNEQGSASFDQFIENLHYGGFYGVTTSHYYITPCDPKDIELYSTTQGFRALLKFRTIPSQVIKVPDVATGSSLPDEEEIDLVPSPEEEPQQEYEEEEQEEIEAEEEEFEDEIQP